jgi:hypothetical protein
VAAGTIPEPAIPQATALYIHGRIKDYNNFEPFYSATATWETLSHPLADVTKLAIDSHCTLLVAFSPSSAHAISRLAARKETC